MQGTRFELGFTGKITMFSPVNSILKINLQEQVYKSFKYFRIEEME